MATITLAHVAHESEDPGQSTYSVTVLRMSRTFLRVHSEARSDMVLGRFDS